MKYLNIILILTFKLSFAQHQNEVVNPGFELDQLGNLVTGQSLTCPDNDVSVAQPYWDEVLNWSMPNAICSKVGSPDWLSGQVRSGISPTPPSGPSTYQDQLNYWNEAYDVFSFNDSTSISEESDSLNEKKNFIELEFLGRGGLYSLNYLRKVINREKFNMSLSVGLSLGSTDFIFQNCFPFVTPVGIGFNRNIFKKQVYLNTTVGVSFLYDPNGTKLSREDVLLDSNGNLFYRTGCPYVPKFAISPYIGIGVGAKVSDRITLQINGYYHGVISSNTLEERIWRVRIGTSILYNF